MVSKSKLFTIIIAISLTLAGIVFLTAQKTIAKSAGPFDKITLGARPGVMVALVWVADAKEFFKEEGLDLSLKEYPSGKWALRGMFKNEVDIATVSEVPVMFNSFQREDFVLFATLGSADNEVKIIARRDKGIQGVSDLEGKKIGAQKGASTHFFLSVFLMHNFIVESEVNVIYMNPDNLVPAIVNGEIDALSWRDPGIQHAKEALGDNAVVFAAPGIYRKTFNLVAMKKFVEDKPEAIERILKALLKAEKFVQENRAEAIAIIARSTSVARDDIAAIWDDVDLKVSLDQSLLVSMEDEARWAIRENLADKKEVPNYLDYIYFDALEDVKPESVTIFH